MKNTDRKCAFDLTLSERTLIDSGLAAAGRGESKGSQAEDYTLSFNIPIARFSTSALLFRLLKVARVSRPILSSAQPGKLARSSSSTFYVDPRLRVHVYACSASRLRSMHPFLSSGPYVSMLVSDLTNAKLLASFLRDCNAIFGTVASNTNLIRNISRPANSAQHHIRP
jgi:hypothetical protein